MQRGKNSRIYPTSTVACMQIRDLNLDDNSMRKFQETSSSAIAERPRCMVG